MTEACTPALPRFSIVTLAFNMEPFIRQTVQSVLGQGYPALDYIVVDPGSTDGTRDALIPYLGRISSFLTDPDRGPADGLNKGFATAKGDIFGYLNGDDLYLPGTLARVAAAFQAHPDVDVVIGNGMVIDGGGRPVRRLYSHRFTPLRDAYGVGFVVQQSTFFRAAAFRRTCGFNPENRTCWDGELLLELALAGCRIMMVDEFWSQFRIYPQSISGSQRMQDRYRADRERMFQRAMGRPRTMVDGVLCRLWQRLDQLASPRRSLAKLHDRLAGPPAAFLRRVGA